MKVIRFNSIVKVPFSQGALIRNDFPGFKEDYLAIHCLLKKYQPKTFMEIGTSTGMGTKIICNALKIRKKRWWNKIKSNNNESIVYSIDVPPGTDPRIIYPDKEDGHPKKTGKHCNFEYHQLFGNSTNFDYSKYYPLEGWFIDGKHNLKSVSKDTRQALKSKPKIIIWHDLQIPEVYRAIQVTMKNAKNYNLFRVSHSRIGFALRTESQ